MNANTQSFVNKLVARFLNQQDDLLIGIHSLGLATESEQRPYVIVAVCEALAAGKGWNKSESGKVMLDSKHAKYESLKTRVRDVMHNLQGETRTSSAKKEPADKVSTLLKAYEKLSKSEQRSFLKALG